MPPKSFGTVAFFLGGGGGGGNKPFSEYSIFCNVNRHLYIMVLPFTISTTYFLASISSVTKSNFTEHKFVQG